jgi:hypothetical protein
MNYLLRPPAKISHEAEGNSTYLSMWTDILKINLRPGKPWNSYKKFTLFVNATHCGKG